MSTDTTDTDERYEFDRQDDQTWDEFVEEHREQIEREANSDAPDAWVFRRLLQSVEGED